MLGKSIAARFIEKLLKISSLGIKVDQAQLNDSLLTTPEQITAELKKINAEIETIEDRCEELNEEAKKYFSGIDKAEELLEQIKGTPAEARFARNIKQWQDQAWAKVRQGVWEEDKELPKRKNALLERKAKLEARLRELN